MHDVADRLHLRDLRLHRDAMLWLAALLSTLVVLVLPAAFRGPAGSEAGRIVSAEILTPQGRWRPVDLHALKLPKGQVSILRAQVDMPSVTRMSGPPLGLYLSGTFSADAAWNGIPVGHKGQPGASARTEVPGPVDAVLPLPTEPRPQPRNLLTLQLSAERFAAPHSIIHGEGAIFGLRVAPFSADARRPIGYYAAPFLMSGLLLLAVISVTARGSVSWPATAVVAGLLICALTELSRSIVDYAYPWHALRMWGLKLAAVPIAVGCVRLAMERSRWRGPAPWDSRATALLIALAFAAPLQAPQLIVVGALTGGLVAAAAAVVRRDSGLGQLAAALLLMAGASRLPSPDYMDQGLYAAAIPLIVQLLWRPRPLTRGDHPVSPETPVCPGPMVVGAAGSRRFLDLAMIRAIHAAGDYVEIDLANGRRLLELRSLGALAENLPPSFVRVHRSHIVNLAYVEELRSEGGGRYRLRVGESLWTPVSRTRIAEVRARLGC
ncbi:MAG: LytTR family transcriptional regulator [Caulobacterales bacterium]|nr:LytTR family transcriptional regulator [Caulobacterales bacterium]